MIGRYTTLVLAEMSDKRAEERGEQPAPPPYGGRGGLAKPVLMGSSLNQVMFSELVKQHILRDRLGNIAVAFAFKVGFHQMFGVIQ